MQKAELILVKLNQKSKTNKDFKFKRLYRNLFNPDFYLYAYSKIQSKEGNMTPGADGNTIDGFNLEWITNTIELLKYERYYPTVVKRTYIPKKNTKKLRPPGIQTFIDKLIQEIIREILEAIYEPLFSENSHGFRSNRSCHTALMQIKRTCTGSSWVIEGDIQSYFDTIDHEIMVKILSRKIDDGRFLELIKRFLKAGYMENGIVYNTITGAPQGGIASPILSNIYLNELDSKMDIIKSKYTKGRYRKVNPEYNRLKNKISRYRKKNRYYEVENLARQMRKLPSRDVMDQNYVRINYIRYADDFVVFIIGSLSLAKQIKTEIAIYLKEELKLKLHEEKTLITNILNNKIRFLGYDSEKAKNDTQQMIDSTGRRRRRVNGIIQLLVPFQIIEGKIREFSKNGKPIHRKDRLNKTHFHILTQYNTEMRGLYNYYCLANNVGKRLNKFQYYHYYSLLKTICRKENSSLTQIYRKYGISVPRKDGSGTKNQFGLKYETKQGEKTLVYFNEPLKVQRNPSRHEIDPNTNKKNKPFCEVLIRLSKGYCELCGKLHGPKELVIHYVRKLKDLKIPKDNTCHWIRLMKKIRRKTLILCYNCHNEIHEN
jgi:group II intron reverse transcriptase/maturase